LSAGAVVGLSATSIVLLESPGASSQRLKTIQSALRDRAATKADVNASKWIRVATCPSGKRCAD
jgi:hypothetical protein